MITIPLWLAIVIVGAVFFLVGVVWPVLREMSRHRIIRERLREYRKDAAA